MRPEILVPLTRQNCKSVIVERECINYSRGMRN